MQAAQTQSLVDQLGQAGVTLSLTTTEALAVSPASLLTDDLRARIRSSKQGLIDWVKAANDPAPTPPKAVTQIGTIRPPELMAVAPALTASIAAAGLNAAPERDRQCFPDSTAMTGAEIDTFTARLSRITDKGVSLTDGEAMADKMLIRDRQAGDWFSCLECAHLGGYGSSSWSCGNWKVAGVAFRASDARLPAELVRQLQALRRL